MIYGSQQKLKGGNMFEKIIKALQKRPAAPPEKEKVSKPKKSEKELATEKGEPYISILSIEVDPENLHQGAFELDWNSVFVTRLVKAGYMMKPTDSDAEIVDRWFQNVCRNIVLETYEQQEAMNPQTRYTRERDLGNGRKEIS